MKRMALLLAAITALIATLPPAAAQGTRGRNQPEPRPPILFVFSPSPKHPMFVAQDKMIVDAVPEFQQSAVIVLFVIGDESVKLPAPDNRRETAENLRKRYHIDADAFRVVLLDKYGSEKARWNEPVEPNTVFSHTDERPRAR